MNQQIIDDIKKVLTAFKPHLSGESNQLLVVGCSTSEVIGKTIGTQGSLDVANWLFHELNYFATLHNLHLAFQCCEHLNRALVVERQLQIQKQLVEVSVIPVPKAGGAMASVAYQQLEDACVVENIQADYAIDIGNTLIGMHLKPVAVPIRIEQKTIGEAYVTLAKTRPKLIGGERSVYRFNK